MRKLFFIITVGVFPFNIIFGQSLPREYFTLAKKADSLFTIKDYTNSALAYSLAFKAGGWKGQPSDRYNAARAWAKSNVPDSAFFNLQRLLDKTNYLEYDKLIKEEDFKSLYNDKRWQPILDKLKSKKLPTGWFRAGSAHKSYDMVIDSTVEQDKRKTLTIKSIETEIDGFGTLMQSFSPEKYSGKRIKMTGYMKSQNVDNWAGFWLRVDGPKDSKKSLSFDNMYDRAVKGTTDWQKYEIVLDVPKEATKIAFGALLHGTGQIWFEKFNFEIVDKSVHTTDRNKSEPNLDFSK